MQYGYFDEKAREYVITNPNTPAPWANYLGSPDYGAIITQNAGGYSFVKSGAAGRILRYMFNQFDEPGRYIYLKDLETGAEYTRSILLPGPQKRGDAARTRTAPPEYAFDIPVGPGRSVYMKIMR